MDKDSIIHELARLEVEAAQARGELEHLYRRRAVQIALGLADAGRNPRDVLRILRQLRRSPSERVKESARRPNVDRLLRSIAEDEQDLGLEIGLRHPYPHLRIGYLGHVPSFRRVAPHVRLDAGQVREDVESRLDAVIVEASWARQVNLKELREILRTCRSNDTPVVLRATKVSDLQMPLEQVQLVVTCETSVAEAARKVVGAEGVLFALPEVETATFNPVGWRREFEHPVRILVGECRSNHIDQEVSELRSNLEMPSQIVSTHERGLHHPELNSSVIVLPDEAMARAEFLRASGVTVLMADSFGCETDYLILAMESLACGTPVVIEGSDCEPDLEIADIAQTAWSTGDVVEICQNLVGDLERRERNSVKTRRVVLREHSKLASFERILSRLDVPQRASAKLSALLSTRRPDRIEQAVREVAKQTYPTLELVVVLHGEGWDAGRVGALTHSVDLDARIVNVSAEWTLGDCLNAGLDVAAGELIAKIDDDDYYGPHHLEDVAMALNYADADLVGKRAHYVHLAKRNVTVGVWRDEQEKFVEQIPGATMVLRRNVLGRYGFRRVPRGVDSELLKSIKTSAARIYSANRFNFVRGRHGAGHTYEQTDEHFMERADESVEGGPPAGWDI